MHFSKANPKRHCGFRVIPKYQPHDPPYLRQKKRSRCACSEPEMISTVHQVQQLHEPFFNPSYTEKKLWDETAKKCPSKLHKLPRIDFEARFKRLVLDYRNNATRNKTYTNQCELSFMNAHIFKNQLVFFDANQVKRNYVCNESGTISRGIYFALMHNKLSSKILLDVLKEAPYEIITQAKFKDVDFGSDHDDDDNDIDPVIESHNDTNNNVRKDNTETEPNEDDFERICHFQMVETEFSNDLDELEIPHASYQSLPRKKTKSEPSDLSNNPHDGTVEVFMKNMETHIPDKIAVNKKSYVLIEESLYNPKVNDAFNINEESAKPAIAKFLEFYSKMSNEVRLIAFIKTSSS